jgi:hypothetical protein
VEKERRGELLCNMVILIMTTRPKKYVRFQSLLILMLVLILIMTMIMGVRAKVSSSLGSRAVIPRILLLSDTSQCHDGLNHVLPEALAFRLSKDSSSSISLARPSQEPK